VDRQRDRDRHVGGPELLHDERPAEVRHPGAADGLRGGAAVNPRAPMAENRLRS
jgi:hypothetical protein